MFRVAISLVISLFLVMTPIIGQLIENPTALSIHKWNLTITEGGISSEENSFPSISEKDTDAAAVTETNTARADVKPAAYTNKSAIDRYSDSALAERLAGRRSAESTAEKHNESDRQTDVNTQSAADTNPILTQPASSNTKISDQRQRQCVKQESASRKLPEPTDKPAAAPKQAPASRDTQAADPTAAPQPT